MNLKYEPASCITQREAQGTSRTCNESQEEEAKVCALWGWFWGLGCEVNHEEEEDKGPPAPLRRLMKAKKEVQPPPFLLYATHSLRPSLSLVVQVDPVPEGGAFSCK